jgi:hypothetical protein
VLQIAKVAMVDQRSPWFVRKGNNALFLFLAYASGLPQEVFKHLRPLLFRYGGGVFLLRATGKKQQSKVQLILIFILKLRIKLKTNANLKINQMQKKQKKSNAEVKIKNKVISRK